MTRFGAFWLFLLFVSSRTQAANSFAEATQNLKRQQGQLDEALRRHGVITSSFSPKSAPKTSEGEHPSLFQVHGDLSRLQIGQGRFLFGQVVNRLVVGPEGSPSIVELDSGQGALSEMRLLGTAHQSSSEGRVIIEFQKLLFRSGKSVAIQASAMDEAGGYGLAAQVVSQKALAVTGAMASSFISGLATAQQTQSSNAFGFQQVQPTGRNIILQGVAQTAADQSKRLIDEATKEKPVLIVEPRTSVSVLVQEEVRF